MSTRNEFLNAVLPPDGVYVAVSIDDNKKVSQTFHNSVAELNEQLETITQQNKNAFFATAAYNIETTRTNDNVKHIRSFFMDLDCDPEDDTKFPDQNTALAELKAFVQDLRLPKPTVVNSGRGIHAYWPLLEPVDRVKWKPVAEKLKQTCMFKGFRIDPAVTADAARILRAPGTRNHKDPSNPLDVEVMRVGEPVAFDDMRKLLGVSEFDLLPATKRPMDEVSKKLLANRPSVFKNILQKSAAGEGCAHILYAVTHQADISEPHWRAVLSIAAHCADKDKAIHKVSSAHPDYNPADTERKAGSIRGPYTCATFQNIDATLCEGCPHFGKIASPIALGAGRVLEATKEDNVVEVPAVGDEPAVVYEIPEYPFPFFRGKNGGVYVRDKREDKSGNTVEEDKLIYEYDFYAVNLIEDPYLGMTALFRVHFPQDGVKEFCVPVKDMLAKDRYRDVLGMKGICPSNSQLENIMAYSNHWVRHHQKLRKASLGRVQFGWADSNSCFIVGDREISSAGITYSPPTANTVDIIPKFRKAGTLDAWKQVTKFYARPGQELPLFALFAGFAAPLMPFTGTRGGVISLYSNKGGTGKTTTLQAINSIFGHPDEAMLIKTDTVNSRVNRVGTMNNIAATTDEITNETPEALSEYIYSMLHGRGKNRLMGSQNIERINKTTWNTISIVTGNSTISDKLYTIKSLPDGELRRLMEFPFPTQVNISKGESDAIFRPLQDNYGHAGEVYIQYILNNMGRVGDLLLKVQGKIDKAAELTQREQYWSATTAACISGGILAKESGALDITDDDIKRVYDWIINQLKVMRGHVAIANIEPDEVLGMFLSEHINDMLIINASVKGGLNEGPIREPKGKLLIRYEPDTKDLMISVAKFREFCTKRQMSYSHTIKALQAAGALHGETRKRLGKGTHISVNERVLVFRNVNEKFVLGEVDVDAWFASQDKLA